MNKTLSIFALLAFISLASYADITLPTFKDTAAGRMHFGDQDYKTCDSDGIKWQLNYWSNGQLEQTALTQALNDVVSDKGKPTGNINVSGTPHIVYHASAGFEKNSATLFYINVGGNSRIIGIGKHVVMKPCQAPIYDVTVWDARFGRP